MTKHVTNNQYRKIVIVNQAVNYLTIGFANAFNKNFDKVALITGSIHVQGEELDSDIEITKINMWRERPAWKKLASYLLGTIRIWWLLLIKYRNYEVFFVSLPPMAYLLNIILPHKFSIVIWDVYPDIFKVTGMKESHILYRVWSKLNLISFSKAYKVFTISDKMADLLSQYLPSNKLIIQPIWSIFQGNHRVDKIDNPFVKDHNLENKFVVQYSGNIGLTHKVEVMVKIAEKMKNNDDILFQIIGRGPRKLHLQNLVKKKKLPNCVFLPFQSDEMFPFSLSAADIGVVILDELTSKGSVPSKSFNLMSYGIPSLYIASEDSQLNLYSQKYNHAECFKETELEKSVEYILRLKSDNNMYNKYSQNAEKAAKDFRRNNADKFVEKYDDINI